MSAWEWLAGGREALEWAALVVGLALVTSWWLPIHWSPRRRIGVAMLWSVVLGGGAATGYLHARGSRILALAASPHATITWRSDQLWIQAPATGGTLANGLLGSPRAVRIPSLVPTERLTRRQARALARVTSRSATWAQRLIERVPQ